MDKPEAPEYVYSAASDVCDRIGDHNSKTFDAIVFGIESAILKAKNDALEEVITLVDQMAESEGSDFGLIEEIRNLKHEG